MNSELLSPKPEPRWLTKEERPTWDNESTLRLIAAIESECRELWDYRSPAYKDRIVRQARFGLLAGTFGTTVEEIARKVHNLRTQFNSEIRKIKRRKLLSGEECGASSWEYFEPLSFLLTPGALDGGEGRAPAAVPPLDSTERVECIAENIAALAEFQEQEAAEFRVRSPPQTPSPPPYGSRRGRTSCCDAAPPKREEPIPHIYPNGLADDCRIFGDFVASELRMLKSDESRKKLKRIIQKAILHVGEEEDGFLK